MRNIVFIERVVWNDSSHVFGHIINWHIRKISKLKSICSNFYSSSKKYKLKLFFIIFIIVLYVRLRTDIQIY